MVAPATLKRSEEKCSPRAEQNGPASQFQSGKLFESHFRLFGLAPLGNLLPHFFGLISQRWQPERGAGENALAPHPSVISVRNCVVEVLSAQGGKEQIGINDSNAETGLRGGRLKKMHPQRGPVDIREGRDYNDGIGFWTQKLKGAVAPGKKIDHDSHPSDSLTVSVRLL